MSDKLDRVVAEAQRNGGVCAYIDAEHAMDPVYAAAIGVDEDVGDVLGVADLERTRGFRLDLGHLSVVGICRDCQEEADG